MAHLNYGSSTGGGSPSPDRSKSEIINDNKTLVSADNGKTLIIKELGANKTITLPTLEDGFAIKLFLLMNNTTYSLAIQAKVSANNLFGFISRISYGGSACGWDTSPRSNSGITNATFPGGSGTISDYNTLTIGNIVAGSFLDLYCDGTYWYICGVAISGVAGATTESSVAFTDETY